MGGLVPGRQLRSATAQFLRPVRGEAAVHAQVLRHGRLMSVTEATAASDDEVHVHASAVWGPARRHAEHVGPTAPAVPPPEECPVFAIPHGDRAVRSAVEVRPVGPARPFTGGTTPELVGRIRLVADQLPPKVAA